MAVQQNRPASMRLAYTDQNYLTSQDLITMSAKAELDLNPQVFGRYGRERLGIMSFLDEFGNKSAATSNEFGHYEQDFTREIVRVTDSYTPGSASATFTVASTTPDFVFEYPTASNQTWYNNYTTGYTQTLREDDVIIADGVEMIVTTVTYGASSTTQTFVAECTQTGETVPDGLENVEIFISGRARSEASTGPTGRETRLIQYRNYIQTIDEAYKVSGTAMGQKSYVRGIGGTDKWFATGIFNTRTNFDALCELTLLTGKQISSTSATFNQYFKTEGVVPFIRNYGNEEAYTVGSFGLQDIDNLIANLKKFYGSNEYILLDSHNLSVEFDDAMRTLNGVDHGISYNQRLLDLGFAGVRRSGVNIYQKTLQGFSDPRTLGSADSEYLNMGLMIPVGTATSFDYNDGQAVEKPTMELKYLDVDGEDMGYKEIVTGGAGPAATDNTDTMTITMRKRMGIELHGANLYGIFVGASA